MGSKLNPGEFDAYAAALPDEPMFVLLARDESAPVMLRAWADRRRADLTHALEADPDLYDDSTWLERQREDLRKCTAADMLAHDMTVWRKSNAGAWRDGSQRRVPMAGADSELVAAIRDAAVRSIANLCMVGSAQVAVQEHLVTPWSVPGFSVRRHYLRLSGKGDSFTHLFGADRGAGPLDLPDFHVTGHNTVLGDVLVKVKGPNDCRLDLQVLEL